jgi:hypothetical protein
MPETTRPQDVPARHDRLAAAMLAPLVDHGLREAVKWVMEPELLAIEQEVEKRVRERIAAEYRDAARAIEDSRREEARDPLAKAIWNACERDGFDGVIHDDPRSIAYAAYRHLAKRLTRSEP